MKDFFNGHMIKLIDFDYKYEAIVLDNSEFDSKYYIKVFIPELFAYDVPKNAIDIKENVKIHNIENRKELLLSNNVYSSNYLKVYPVISNYYINRMDNNFDWLEKEDVSDEEFNQRRELLIKYYKPNIGDTVIVSFFNGNPATPIYSNEFICKKIKDKIPVNDFIKKNDKKDDKKDDGGEIEVEPIDPIDPDYPPVDPDHPIDPDNPPSRYYYYRGYERLLYYNKDIIIKGADVRKIIINFKTIYKDNDDKLSILNTLRDEFTQELEIIVKDFQKEYGITADGVIGPITYDYIYFLAYNKK